MPPVADVVVGFKAHLGWLTAVAVGCEQDTPTGLASHRVDLFTDQPREILEPYHVAAGWRGLERVPAPADPAAVVERALARQRTLAIERLGAFRQTLRAAGWRWQSAVMLTGRGGQRTLHEALRSHALVHIAEGEAVRAATRAALRKLRIPCFDQDEKATLEAASRQLGLSPKALARHLKATRPATARAWGKEQQTVAAAAWLAATRATRNG